MATIRIIRTRALRTVTMVLTGSTAVSLLALGRGSVAIMVAGATTVGQDTATTVGAVSLVAASLVADQATPDAVVSLQAAQLDADRLGVASEEVPHLEVLQEAASVVAVASTGEAALAVADAGRFNIRAGSTLHIKRSA